MSFSPRRTEQRSLPMEWRLGVALIVVAGVLMSGFFDSLMIQVLGRGEVDRSIRVATAVLIAALLGLVVAAAATRPVPREYAMRRRPAWEMPLLLMLGLTPLWTLVGFINEWPVTYILGDVFMLALLPATYFALVWRPLDDPARVFRWIYGVMVGLAILSSLLVLYHNLLSGGRHKMSVDAAIPPVYYIMLKTAPAPWEVVLLPFFAVAALLTSKRSTWAALALAALMAMVLRPGLRRSFRMAIAGAGVGVIVLAVMYARPELVDHSVDLIDRRWQETLHDLSGGKGSDLSVDSGGRVGEAVGVFDTIAERRTVVDWAMGLGFGAIVQARGGRLRHHVHSTPAAFLARTGLIGLGLWIAFVVLVLRTLMAWAWRPPDEWHRVQFLFWTGLWISMMVFSLKSQAFWGSAMGGIQLAYLSHLCRGAERARAERAAAIVAPAAGPPAAVVRRRQRLTAGGRS